MNVRTLLIAGGIAAMALVAPSSAAAWTTQGGAVLESGHDAVEVAVGWPGLRLGGRIPLKAGFEVGPYGVFNFWNDLMDSRPTLGNALGCLVKVNLVDRGAFQLAVQGDPAFRFEYWPDGARIGWQIGFPEVLMSYTVTPGLDLDFGFKAPLALVFDPQYRVEVRLPLLLNMGFEFALASNLNLFGSVDVGPNFRFAQPQPRCDKTDPDGYQRCDVRHTTGGDRIGLYVNAMVGVTYRMP